MKAQKLFFSTLALLFVLLLVACNLPENSPTLNPLRTTPTLTVNPAPTSSTPLETSRPEGTPPGKMEPTLAPGVNETYIEGILQHSTVIVDADQDWILHKPEIDNPILYPVDFGDIHSMKVGVDERYLYIKLEVNGTVPGKGLSFPVFNGDHLMSFGTNLGFDIDNNSMTGCLSDGGTEIMTGYGIKYENGNIHTNWLSYMTDPTGTETPEDARYKNRIFDQENQYGGEGQNYFILTFPLSVLHLTRGQEITLDAWVEVSSQRYDHASFDMLCPQSLVDPSHPLFCPIKIKLGQETVIR